MRIHRLTAFRVPIALRRPVRHASHERTTTDNVIVRCVLEDGSLGWGEGLPRSYVTGDSIESAWRHLTATDWSPLRDGRFDSAAQWVRLFDEFTLADVAADPGVPVRGAFGNSVRCAVELALLDAALRSEGRPLHGLVQELLSEACDPAIGEPASHVHYSGVVTSDALSRQCWSALKQRAYGLRQLKLKLGTPGQNDLRLVSCLRRIAGRNADLRGDANEAWHCEEVVTRMRPLLRFGLSCLEQPVPHAEVAGLAEVRRELPLPVMLDESLCCAADADRAIAGGWCDLFNIRLSKCGGVFRSLQLIRRARQAGLGFQLGCQVGETGILSAAGRHMACCLPDARYVEGSFDGYLVQDRLTEQNLTFGFGGRAPRLDGPGLGVTVDECRVRALAVRQLELIASSGTGFQPVESPSH
jgi:muconate cycloisomerase